MDLEEVKRVSDKSVFGRPGLWPKFLRFASLLVLAAFIAAFGLLVDSIAALVGAMSAAPLMPPIMGLAFSVSIGEWRRIVSTLIVSLVG